MRIEGRDKPFQVAEAVFSYYTCTCNILFTSHFVCYHLIWTFIQFSHEWKENRSIGLRFSFVRKQRLKAESQNRSYERHFYHKFTTQHGMKLDVSI